ncbi:MAG TPA: hypothetical protein VNN10_13365 [Dehalococcoidia bacterium]|nr:hypothetical protein [Dehalococcoidia bacterium]
MADKVSRWGRAISRRQFFELSAAGAALLAAGEGLDYAREMWRQQEAWAAAALPNDEFLRQHGTLFRNVALGASFAPEQWTGGAERRGASLAALDWLSRDLGIRHVRLGLRWQRVEWRRGHIDLSMYRPYLDYAFGNGLQVCLNVGPIRTFRWPEEHLPSWLPGFVQVPPDGARIRAGTPLTEAASDYASRLLEALTREYGAERLSSLPAVQTENEPFYRFRTHRWVLDEDYVLECIRRLNSVFPRSLILVSSAGRLDFGPIQDLFSKLLAEGDEYRGRLVMGFDYHYKTPQRDSFPVIRWTDPITFQRVGYQTCDENREMARSLGYAIEVTEGQAEPFGHLSEPGNSARHFRFMLLRCAGRVLLPEQPSLIRIWGVEEMAKKVLSGETTPEHEAIFDLVRRINAGV